MNAPHQAHLPVNPHPDPAPGKPLPLAGLTVLVTGDLPGWSRARALDTVSVLGGKPVTSVSSRTSLVVVGDGAGVSKMNKVRMHQIPVLPGDRFVALATDPASWDGQPVGMSLADFEASTEPRPNDRPDPAADRAPGHHVTQATCYVRVHGRVVQQIRLSCECGHRWLGQTVHAIGKGCPVAAGLAVVLCRDEPWASLPSEPEDHEPDEEEPAEDGPPGHDRDTPPGPTDVSAPGPDHATRYTLARLAWAFA